MLLPPSLVSSDPDQGGLYIPQPLSLEPAGFILGEAGGCSQFQLAWGKWWPGMFAGDKAISATPSVPLAQEPKSRGSSGISQGSQTRPGRSPPPGVRPQPWPRSASHSFLPKPSPASLQLLVLPFLSAATRSSKSGIFQVFTPNSALLTPATTPLRAAEPQDPESSGSSAPPKGPGSPQGALHLPRTGAAAPTVLPEPGAARPGSGLCCGIRAEQETGKEQSHRLGLGWCLDSAGLWLAWCLPVLVPEEGLVAGCRFCCRCSTGRAEMGWSSSHTPEQPSPPSSPVPQTRAQCTQAGFILGLKPSNPA